MPFRSRCDITVSVTSIKKAAPVGSSFVGKDIVLLIVLQNGAICVRLRR
jgi:hypothetical protein